MQRSFYVMEVIRKSGNRKGEIPARKKLMPVLKMTENIGLLVIRMFRSNEPIDRSATTDNACPFISGRHCPVITTYKKCIENTCHQRRRM